ncbi:DUF6691 family protein [Leisingera methylohalidivorans]|uniref:DUF6691 family protein n=1 Tax=Leisingera methylohalidivorans TaxID=133924 RepID=UPI00316AC318
MATPAKVLNCFDFAGILDPSLIFVMGRALVTTSCGYRIVLGLSLPLLAERFNVPSRRDLDPPPYRRSGSLQRWLGDCRVLPRRCAACGWHCQA